MSGSKKSIALDYVTLWGRKNDSDNLNYDSLNLCMERRIDLEEFAKESGDTVEEIKSTDVRRPVTYGVTNNVKLHTYNKKLDLNNRDSISCVLKCYSSKNSNYPESQPSKRRRIDDNEETNSAGLILNLYEMEDIFSAINISHEEFMSVETPRDFLIREGEKMRIYVRINCDEEYAPRRIDIRLFYLSKNKTWLKTKYGITLEGYQELQNLHNLEAKVMPRVRESSDFLIMCKVLTMDMVNRFLVYNAYLPLNSGLSKNPQTCEIRKMVIKFMFGDLITHYNKDFISYMLMGYNLKTCIDVGNILECISGCVVESVKKRFDDKTVIVTPMAEEEEPKSFVNIALGSQLYPDNISTVTINE